MPPVLLGKCTFVSGGSSGLGRDIAIKLAAEGANVALTYRSNENGAKETIAAIEKNGGEAAAFQLDIAEVESIGGVLERARDELGGLDIAIANAGVGQLKPIAEVTPEDFDTVTGINARGAFFFMKEAAARLEEGGRIIAVTSGQALNPATGFAVYAGTKAATHAYVQVLALELGKSGIRVNAVVAGPIDDGMLGGADDEYKDHLREQVPLGRLGKGEDIANATAWLASDDADWVTGRLFEIDGGATGY